MYVSKLKVRMSYLEQRTIKCKTNFHHQKTGELIVRLDAAPLRAFDFEHIFLETVY